MIEGAKIECNSPNLARIFSLASKKLENANYSKHFAAVKVNGPYDDELVLNRSSFADITFDQFTGRYIKLIHREAFGKSSKTIKDFQIMDHVNHSPPEYDVWKMLNSLVNVMQIRITSNITEIPSYAFYRQFNLRTLKIQASNGLTISNKAFYHLDYLTHLTIEPDFNLRLRDYPKYKELIFYAKIQNGAFAFENPSNQKLSILFAYYKFDDESFEPGSFDGIKRPVELKLQNSPNKYLPETITKLFLNNPNNTIAFHNSDLNCSDCRNLWLFKENPYDQLKSVRCILEDKKYLLNILDSLALYSFEAELLFKSNCNLTFTPNNKSEINYYPCQYNSEKVRFKFQIIKFIYFIY